MLFDTQRTSKTQLRWFSAFWLPAGSLVVAVALSRRGYATPALSVAIAGFLVGALGLVWPRVANAVYRTLTWVTLPIGWVVSWVLMIALYFLFVTPIGAVMRVLHDPMHRRFDRATASYWTRRPAAPRERYFRQF